MLVERAQGLGFPSTSLHSLFFLCSPEALNPNIDTTKNRSPHYRDTKWYPNWEPPPLFSFARPSQVVLINAARLDFDNALDLSKLAAVADARKQAGVI